METQYKNYVIQDRHRDPIELVIGAIEEKAKSETQKYPGATYQEVESLREVGRISDEIRERRTVFKRLIPI